MPDPLTAAQVARLHQYSQLADTGGWSNIAPSDVAALLAAHQAAAPVLAAAVAFMHSTVGDSYVAAFDALSTAVEAWEGRDG